MNFLLPFFSSGVHEVGVVLDKLCLRRNSIGFKTLLLIEFSGMFVIAGAYVVLAHVPLPTFTLEAAGVVLAILLLSFAQNIFELKGIQAMRMNMREPISNLQPILTGVLAYLIFPSEGDVRYVFAIIAGVLIVMWSSGSSFSWRHIFTAGSGYVFGDISLSAVLDNLTKFGLLFVSPAYLTLFRTGGVLFLCSLFLRPSRKDASPRGLMLGSGAGILYGIAALTRVFSVQELGLNFTLLVMMLGPGLLYLLSYAVLRERFTWRPILGSLAIAVIIFAVR